eukprot:SAG11_NODE_811_length_7065_cov_2.641114_3_plen_1861_part_00
MSSAAIDLTGDIDGAALAVPAAAVAPAPSTASSDSEADPALEAASANETTAGGQRQPIDLADSNDFPAEHFDLLRSDSTKSEFFNVAAAHLESLRVHWWCTRSRVMTEMLYLYQHKDNPVVKTFIAKVGAQLRCCSDCVACYHAGRRDLHRRYTIEYEEGTVAAFFGVIKNLDIERLVPALGATAPQTSQTLLRTSPAPGCLHELHDSCAKEWSNSVYEVLGRPELLSNRRVVETLSVSLCKMLTRGDVILPRHDGIEGILLLLAHPSVQIQTWAIETVGSTVLRCSQNLQEVFQQLTRVVELDSFNDSASATDEDEGTQYRYQRLHFWKGLHYVLQCVDIGTSSHKLSETFSTFASMVANSMGHSSVFLDAMRCFKLICEGLGSKVWTILYCPVSLVVETLTKHCTHRRVDDSGSAAQRVAVDLAACVLRTLQSVEYVEEAVPLIRCIGLEIVPIGRSQAGVAAAARRALLETVGQCIRHCPQLVARTHDVWVRPAVESLTAEADAGLSGGAAAEVSAERLLKEAISAYNQVIRRACSGQNEAATDSGAIEWMVAFFGRLLDHTPIVASIAGAMVYFMSAFSLLDLELVVAAQHSAALASLAQLRVRLARCLAAKGSLWSWESRADCLMSVFPHLVSSDKPVADAVASMVRAHTGEEGLVQSLQTLAARNIDMAAPDSVHSSPRKHISLGRHFVAGVCSTLSQLVHWRPAKCLRSLAKLFLYMKIPSFLEQVIGDAEWGSDAASNGWSIATAFLSELVQLPVNTFLLVNFFEFFGALWPHVLSSVKAGSFSDDDSDFKTNAQLPFPWFRNLVVSGRKLDQAAKRRWQSCCEAVVDQLPRLTADPAATSLIVSFMSSAVDEAARSADGVTIELRDLRRRLQAEFPSVCVRSVASGQVSTVGRGSRGQTRLDAFVSKNPAPDASGTTTASAAVKSRPSKFVSMASARWGSTSQGTQFVERKKSTTSGWRQKPKLLRQAASKNRRSKKGIASLLPKWQSAADSGSGSSSDSDSDDSGVLARSGKQPGKPQQRRHKGASAQRLKNLLEEMGGEPEDPMLIKLRAVREKQAKQRQQEMRLREAMPTAGAASWQSERAIVAKRRPRPKLDLNNLYRQVLQWDARRIAQQALPTVDKVRERFGSEESYIQQFEPLLLLECHAQVIQAHEELGRGRSDGIVDMKLQKASIQRVDQDHFLIFYLPFEDDGPREHDLVILTTSAGRTGSDAKTKVKLFGLVEKDTTEDAGPRRGGRGEKKKKELRVKVSVSDAGERSSVVSKAISHRTTFLITTLCNLATIEREYIALYGVLDSGLRDTIFQNRKAVAAPPTRLLNLRTSQLEALKQDFNKSQVRAIRAAFGGPERVVLLQGPPGTGKTRTIMGLLRVFLDASAASGESAKQRPRALVCAPSNAAVDELVLRIMALNREGGVLEPDAPVPVVRVGDRRKVHELVQAVHIDTLLEQAMQRKNLPKGIGSKAIDRRSGQQQEQLSLNEQISAVHEQRTKMAHLGRGDEEYDALTGRLSALHTKKDEINAALNKSFGLERRLYSQNREARDRARVDILNRAEVVCCTLSAAGSKVLCERGAVRASELLVVDEAAQATECSTLVPLRHLASSRSRAVLVGDPRQLPATVLSMAAQAAQAGRSLFARLQACRFAVQMLDTQYRMHPAIAAFPSRHFYGAKLRDGSNVLDRTPPLYAQRAQFGPAVFWDVHSVESRSGASICNALEAAVVARLLRALFAAYPGVSFKGKVGVLTPYSAQRSELGAACRRALTAAQNGWVEINTVDGFQGREKDIIVFSCVRAPKAPKAEGGSEGGGRGIGFLADVRRMNVALTRARHACWVVGHAKARINLPFPPHTRFCLTLPY